MVEQSCEQDTAQQEGGPHRLMGSPSPDRDALRDSGRPSARTAARELGLHVIGAIGAIAVLTLSIDVTLRLFPESAVSFRSASRAPINEVWSSSRSSPALTPAKSRDLRRARATVRRTAIRMPKVRPTFKAFAPPPVHSVPAVVEFVEVTETPVIASVDAEAVTPPLPEFALPPRPKRGVVKVFAALAYPFKSIGAMLVRPRHVTVLTAD
jgi:hypothetical protein